MSLVRIERGKAVMLNPRGRIAEVVEARAL